MSDTESPEEFEQPPDPNQVMPRGKGFAEHRWAAYQLLADGKTQAAVARELGFARSTVATWVIAWRKKYGGNLFRGNRVGSMTHMDTDGTLKVLNGTTRRHFAETIGANSLVASNLLNKALVGIMKDEARIADMSIGDLKLLSDIITNTVAVSDRLSGTPHPDRVLVQQQNNYVGNSSAMGKVEEIDLGQLDTDDDLRETVAGLGAFLTHAAKEEEMAAIEVESVEADK